MSTSLMAEADVTEALPFEFQGQVVLILCGLIASGKVSYLEFELTFTVKLLLLTEINRS